MIKHCNIIGNSITVWIHGKKAFIKIDFEIYNLIYTGSKTQKISSYKRTTFCQKLLFIKTSDFKYFYSIFLFILLISGKMAELKYIGYVDTMSRDLHVCGVADSMT